MREWRMKDRGKVEGKRKKKKKRRETTTYRGGECLIETSEEGSALVSGFTECEKFKPARVLLAPPRSSETGLPCVYWRTYKIFLPTGLLLSFSQIGFDPVDAFLLCSSLYRTIYMTECATTFTVGGVVNFVSDETR